MQRNDLYCSESTEAAVYNHNWASVSSAWTVSGLDVRFPHISLVNFVPLEGILTDFLSWRWWATEIREIRRTHLRELGAGFIDSLEQDQIDHAISVRGK